MLPRLASVALRSAAAATRLPSRSASTGAGGSVGGTAYNVVMRRNVTYISALIVGAIVVEAVYGRVTEGIFTSMNRGKTFATTDWTKFKVEE